MAGLHLAERVGPPGHHLKMPRGPSDQAPRIVVQHGCFGEDGGVALLDGIIAHQVGPCTTGSAFREGVQQMLDESLKCSVCAGRRALPKSGGVRR